MADKQLKRCDKNDFIFCTTDVFMTQYDNEKGKIITIIYFLIRFAKRTWLNYAVYTASFFPICEKIVFGYI